MIVKLTDGELDAIRLQGSMRQRSNEVAHTTNLNYTEQDGYDRNTDGFMGEYAFGKWQNLHTDLDISVRSGSYDHIWRMMRTDVKVTRTTAKNPHLCTSMKINTDVDAFVFGVIIDDNTVDFKGWYPANLLYQQVNVGELVPGKPCYKVSSSKLNPF